MSDGESHLPIRRQLHQEERQRGRTEGNPPRLHHAGECTLILGLWKARRVAVGFSLIPQHRMGRDGRKQRGNHAVVQTPPVVPSDGGQQFFCRTAFERELRHVASAVFDKSSVGKTLCTEKCS